MIKDAISIREYIPSDKEAVLKLIRFNTPCCFAPEEEADLNRYLDHEREYYYVVPSGLEVIGCEGINMADYGTRGKISRDIIYLDWQGCAFGSLLLKHRISVLKSMGINRIMVRTSQVAYQQHQTSGHEQGRKREL